MKTIYTLVSLFLIAATAVASAVLYLNESYGFSAILIIVWILSMTFWIRSTGWLSDEKHSTPNA